MTFVGFAFHPQAELPLSWSWDPWPLAGLLLALGVYGRGLARMWSTAGSGRGISGARALCFTLGIITCAAALISPLDRWSDSLFSAHMSQHELLMVVSAPLVVLGRPAVAAMWALPRPARASVAHAVSSPRARWAWQFVSAPLFVLVLHAIVRWVWHLPSLFEAAMQSEALHAFQHLTFFGSAALFWWALIHGRYGRAGYGLSVLFVFATALHTSVLGALISVAPRVFYRVYEARAPGYGWDPLSDQQLAGLIMWVPSGLLFLVCGLSLFAAWLGEAERRARREASSSARFGPS